MVHSTRTAIVKLGTPSGFSVLSDTGEIFVLPEPAGLGMGLVVLATLAWLRRDRGRSDLAGVPGGDRCPGQGARMKPSYPFAATSLHFST